jgi:hypothetical protein
MCAHVGSYNVIDADGHVPEPFSLWKEYMDPALRERVRRMIIDENGEERLTVEGKLLGDPRGIGSLDAAGVRQAAVKPDSVKFAEGRKGGFDPYACVVDINLTASKPLSFIRASLCLPARPRITNSPPRCAAPVTAG